MWKPEFGRRNQVRGEDGGELTQGWHRADSLIRVLGLSLGLGFTVMLDWTILLIRIFVLGTQLFTWAWLIAAMGKWNLLDRIFGARIWYRETCLYEALGDLYFGH